MVIRRSMHCKPMTQSDKLCTDAVSLIARPRQVMHANDASMKPLARGEQQHGVLISQGGCVKVTLPSEAALERITALSEVATATASVKNVRFQPASAPVSSRPETTEANSSCFVSLAEDELWAPDLANSGG